MFNNSLINTIGNTPAIYLDRYSTKKVKIFAKLEGNNPGGSIKDRIALYMIKEAVKNKLLNQEKTIIEATSGNTGIGLAMLSAVLNYKFTAVMPESVSIERRKILKMYGARIILTDGNKGTDFAYQFVRELIKEEPDKYVMLDQFSNIANVSAHYETTGMEIIKKVPNITHFTAGMGTGGTLMGVGKRLKNYNSLIQVVGIEPKIGSKIQGLRNMSNFIPAIFDVKHLDDKLTIEDTAAFQLARDLFKKEGLSVGISSGAVLWGAMEVTKKIKEGIIVTVFPDRGDKYLSTGLFS